MSFGQKVMIILFFIILLHNCKDCPLAPAYVAYIEKNLQLYKDGITQQMIENAKQVGSMCTVTIKNGKVITDCKTYMLKYSELLFDPIAADLPDMELVLNDRDQPRVFKHICSKRRQEVKWNQSCYCDPGYQHPAYHSFFNGPTFWSLTYNAPMFSSTTMLPCFGDILLPSIHHVPKAKVKDLEPSDYIDWQKKEFKAFWRGGLNGDISRSASQMYQYHRSKLILLCQKIKYCDARASKYNPSIRSDFIKQFKEKLGNESYVPFKKQLKYKILIDIDGITYSQRFPRLLKSGSAVFKIHAFDDIGIIAAKPWEHFVPIKMDLSDLEEKIEWARNNDKQLQQIAERGRKFAQEIYTDKTYQCYAKHLLLKYHGLLMKGKIASLQKEEKIPAN